MAKPLLPEALWDRIAHCCQGPGGGSSSPPVGAQEAIDRRVVPH
jgi:hypothetical protein